MSTGFDIQTGAATTRGRAKGVRTRPEVALLVSTYQKPSHLRRVLASIAMQQGVAGAMEVVVTDDGSTDETQKVVHQFVREVPFRVDFTTHKHEAFQLARCRNEGAALSRAPYLLFLDGDCLLPPDHVVQHLRHRQPGQVMAGYCCRLDQATSAKIDEQAVRAARYIDWAPPEELKALTRRDWKARFYSWMRHPNKPKMAGGNVGVWRSDYERVNGYDENFQGWGGEDDDLRQRLARIGVRVASILRWTRTYHLWHPRDPSTPATTSQGANFNYLNRPGRLTRCRHGLVKRSFDEIDIRVQGAAHNARTALQLLGDRYRPDLNYASESAAEVEIVITPGTGRFSRQADCNLLIALGPDAPPRNLLKQAQLVVADRRPAGLHPRQAWYKLDQFNTALNSIG